MSGARRTESRVHRRTRLIPARVIAWLAVAFTALLTVVVILLTFGRHTQDVRMELANTIEPANAALLDLQRVLALQMAAQRSYRLGMTAQSLDDYDALLLREERAVNLLVRLAQALGPATTEDVTELRVVIGRWHAWLESDPVRPDGERRLLSTREGAFATVLEAAQHVSDRIVGIAAQRRQTIQQRQRIEDLLVIAMVLLVGLALLALARVGRRLEAVTAQAQRNADIAEENHEELLSIAQDKETFIRGITHDLKNPLGVIDGAAELLEIGARGEITADQRDMVARIRRAADEMMGIIGDLLELSRAGADALRMDAQEVDANRLVSEVVDDYRATLESSGLTIRFQSSVDDHALVTDPVRVREILGNLLTNTVRHTPRGGVVSVALRKALDEAGRSVIDIDVRDTGTGVPADLRDVIFDEFARGTHSRGSGIGLAIGRKMARALGGDLRLTETSERGSWFTLRLPLSPMRETARAGDRS